MIAYELRADYAGDVEQVLEHDPETGEPTKTQTVPLFTGGVLTLGDERTIDLREELDKGDGRILIREDDSAALYALDGYPALKRVQHVDEDAGKPASGLGELPVTELRAKAAELGLSIEQGTRKPELVAGLEEHSRRLAEGDQAVNAGARIKADGSLELAGAAPTPEATS